VARIDMKNWMKKEYTEGLVSVIVPCYNRENLVVETLESVYQQTYRPIELIVVDDGSSDNSRKVVEEWVNSKNDNEFKIEILHQNNGGPSKARNTGLSTCNGEYIQFLDSDDILHPDKLKVQLEILRSSKKDFCVCNYKPFYKHSEDDLPIVDFYSRSHSINDFPITYPMDTPVPLYKRSAILTTGPWNNYIWASEDFEYNFRLVCRGAKGLWINQVLVYVRKHDNKERIQAIPLRKRYRFMYHGLVEMEMEAREQRLCNSNLLRNFGIRALKYYYHMKNEGDGDIGKIFLIYAIPKMKFFRILLFFFKMQIWKKIWSRVYPGGPSKLLKTISIRLK
jgi:glycosyltransferase involved in cell wall biosynthesis